MQCLVVFVGESTPLAIAIFTTNGIEILLVGAS